MEENITTKYLKAFASGEQRKKEQEMVSTFVGMMRPESKGKPQPSNALEAEMLKNAQQ